MPSASASVLRPDWAAPAGVRALVTLRHGGVSAAPWDSFNLGDHVGDVPAAVAHNRLALARMLPAQPLWLRQVHGTRCIDAGAATTPELSDVEADASFTRRKELVCAVLTADCLPVLLCDESAQVVAAAHAGWRGLAAGVIESTVAAMQVAPGSLMAWLGPAIGPTAFEVGSEVRAAFIAQDLAATDAFVPAGNRQADKWLCDLVRLATQRLNGMGIHRVASADFCTVRDREHFFSFRRDGVTGRMASCIWLE